MMKDDVRFSIAILLLLVALGATISRTQIIWPEPPEEVAFQSYHRRYVTARGEEDGWALRQDTDLGPCGWFTQHHLANGKVALETCHGLYVTARESCNTRQACMLGQESRLGECGQFDLYELGENRVALKTCAGAGNFLTAADGGWPPPSEWSIVGYTDVMLEWEIFTVRRP